MSYAITDRAVVENVMLFGLYKIIVGGSCRTPTNQSRNATVDLSGEALGMTYMVSQECVSVLYSLSGSGVVCSWTA